jgi:hypothetical protein
MKKINLVNSDVALLISSSGGHWKQLMRLKGVFDKFDKKLYVTTDKSYASSIDDGKFYAIKDASRWNKVDLIIQAVSILFIVIKNRPGYIISTGASCGLIAILFGHFLGAKTIWVDSIANAETLSMSGKYAKKFSDLWLTQWEHLSTAEGPFYYGKVL